VRVIHLTALIDRLLDELLDEARRMGRRSIADGRFDGADDLRFERRIAFLQVHRHLRVADAAAERPDKPVQQQADKNGDGYDAERNDGRGAEAERFEAGRREQQRHDRAGDDDEYAAKGEALPWSLPGAIDTLAVGTFAAATAAWIWRVRR
jgi:hypothetical protein